MPRGEMSRGMSISSSGSYVDDFRRKVPSRTPSPPPTGRHVADPQGKACSRDGSPYSGSDYEDLVAFRDRYPVDDRCWDFLKKAGRAVQSTVISDFRPKREGEDDYSALLTNFTRQVKSRISRLAFPGTRQPLENPSRWNGPSQRPLTLHGRDIRGLSAPAPGEGLGRDADDAFESVAPRRSRRHRRRRSRREVQPARRSRRGEVSRRRDRTRSRSRSRRRGRHRHRRRSRRQEQVRRDEEYYSSEEESEGYENEYEYEDDMQPSEAAEDRLDSRDRGNGHCRNSRDDMDEREPQEEEVMLDEFRNRYPMDDRAFKILVRSPPAVQAMVVSDFKPKREGDDDYSALIVTFTRNCQARVSRETAAEEQQREERSGRLERRRKRRHSRVRRHSRRDDQNGESKNIDSLTEFRHRYPMDGRAWDLLLRVDDFVQESVLVDFRPKREGEADYSALITAFVRSIQTRANSHG